MGMRKGGVALREGGVVTTIDRVMLSREAIAAWHRVAKAAAPLLRGIADVPDEDAEPLADGTLRIHVTHPVRGVLAEMLVPATEWAWAPTQAPN